MAFQQAVGVGFNMFSLKIATIYLSSSSATFWGVVGAMFILVCYYLRKRAIQTTAQRRNTVTKEQTVVRRKLKMNKGRTRLPRVKHIGRT